MIDSNDNGQRPRAPTITVTTSAGHEPAQQELDSTSATTARAHGSLAVPQRSRGGSIDSHSTQSSTGSTNQSQSEKRSIHFERGSEETVWKPVDDEEAALFQQDDSPFGVTRGHLSKLLPRKDLQAYYYLNGLHGLEKALQTDVRNGLSSRETMLANRVTWQDVKSAAPLDQDVLSKPNPAAAADNSETKVEQSTASEFVDRKRHFSDNRLPKKPSKPFWAFAWEALQDKILILLCFAAVISLALGIYESISKKPGEGARIEWVEGVAILVAITLVVMVTASVDWRKERQFRRLKNQAEDRTVKAVRDGKTVTVSYYDIFVGDVLVLEQGDVVPADGIFITGHNVTCDESSATGESDMMKKIPGVLAFNALLQEQEPKKIDPFILSGAKVAEGFGTYLVTAVGVNSSYGRLMMSLIDDDEATPLQYKLNILASYIAKLGSSAGLILFTVTFIEFLANLGSPAEVPNAGNLSPSSQTPQPKTPQQKGAEFIDLLITAVTIVVVAVPEGLPLAVTLALAFATRRMGKDNNLVRRLKSCETMGNATIICSDKTGTLTQNVMTVVAASFGKGTVRAGDKDKFNSDPSSKMSDGVPGSVVSVSSTDSQDFVSKRPVEMPIYQLHERISQEVQGLLKESIAINSTAFESDENGKKTFVGSKTETAILDFAVRCFGLANLAKERDSVQVAQLIPFDSGKKCMGVVIKKADDKYRLLIKGASEIVLAKCSNVLADPLSSVESVPMAEEDKQTIGSFISAYASMSLRTIGMAYRDFSEWPPAGAVTDADDPKQAKFESIFKRLTWLSVVGIQDPVRSGVPEAVATCEKAGVRVIMVTGDNVETARAIAKETGILKEGGYILEGPQFRAMPQAELLMNVLPTLCVLARSSPEDKKILVNTFRAQGEIVAVTGDGTNDAPALKAADVGFSMGITGTEIAKEASDIILLDDNFTSIVKALGWGRAINDAVKKFLQFQITVNIVAVALTFITAVASTHQHPVLNAVQLLWVNLIMDTFAALALATDRPSSSLLDRKPERRGSSLINVTMWKSIVGQSIFQLIITLVMYFAGKDFIPYDCIEGSVDPVTGSCVKNSRQFDTLVFNTFVWLQIFDCVNSRRIDNKLNIFEGMLKNKWFLMILAIMGAGQALIVSVGGAAFLVTRLTGVQWAISIVLGSLSLPLGAILRFIPDEKVKKPACFMYKILAPVVRAIIKVLTPVARLIWTVIASPFRLIRRLFFLVTPKSWREKEGGGDSEQGMPPARGANGAFTTEWYRVSHQVHDNLARYKHIRGRRLNYIKMSLKQPKDLFQLSRTGSRHSVLPAFIAPGAMAGSVGGGVTPTDQRSTYSRSSHQQNDGASLTPTRTRSHFSSPSESPKVSHSAGVL